MTNFVNKNKRAFTLVEILITLGIIGVIAVLTLPNMIKNHQERVLSTQKAAVVEELTASGTLLMSELKEMTFQESKEYKNREFFKDYVKISKRCAEKQEECFANIYYDEDDSSAKITDYLDSNAECALSKKGYVACINDDIGIVDVNGKQGPNKFGVDVFGLYFDSMGMAGLTDMPALGITQLSCGENKLKAVKAVKEICGLGLKEAKDMVDSGNPDCGNKAKNTALKGELLSLGCTFKNSSSYSNSDSNANNNDNNNNNDNSGGKEEEEEEDEDMGFHLFD